MPQHPDFGLWNRRSGVRISPGALEKPRKCIAVSSLAENTTFAWPSNEEPFDGRVARCGARPGARGHGGALS
jgi:hypothetical protein